MDIQESEDDAAKTSFHQEIGNRWLNLRLR